MIADRAIVYGLSQHQGWSLIADRYITSCLQLLFLRVAVRDRLHLFLGRAVNDRQVSLTLFVAVRDRQHSFLSAAVNDRLHLFLGLAVNDR